MIFKKVTYFLIFLLLCSTYVFAADANVKISVPVKIQANVPFSVDVTLNSNDQNVKSITLYVVSEKGKVTFSSPTRSGDVWFSGKDSSNNNEVTINGQKMWYFKLGPFGSTGDKSTSDKKVFSLSAVASEADTLKIYNPNTDSIVSKLGIGNLNMVTSSIPLIISASCTPSCGIKVCGSDGCGGSCGTCATGSSCGADGNCAANPNVKEDCSNGKDDDSDTKIDCADTDCWNDGSSCSFKSCTTTTDCGTGWLCDKGTCYLNAVGSNVNTIGPYCKSYGYNNFDWKGPNGASKVCVECLQNDQCTGGKVCDAAKGRCVAPVTCSTPADWNVVWSACSVQCGTGTQTATSTTAKNGCTGTGGKPTTQSELAEKTQSCTGTVTCPSGQMCTDGQCQSGTGNGANVLEDLKTKIGDEVTKEATSQGKDASKAKDVKANLTFISKIAKLLRDFFN